MFPACAWAYAAAQAGDGYEEEARDFEHPIRDGVLPEVHVQNEDGQYHGTTTQRQDDRQVHS